MKHLWVMTKFATRIHLINLMQKKKRWLNDAKSSHLLHIHNYNIILTNVSSFADYCQLVGSTILLLNILIITLWFYLFIGRYNVRQFFQYSIQISLPLVEFSCIVIACLVWLMVASIQLINIINLDRVYIHNFYLRNEGRWKSATCLD